MEIIQIIWLIIKILIVAFILFGFDLPGVIFDTGKFLSKLIIALAIIGVIIYIAFPFVFPQFSLGGFI